MPRLESMFLMAKAASLGIVGETLMIPSATSRIESTRASNSMLFRSRDAGLEVRLRGHVLRDLDLFQPVQDHRQVAVGHFEYLDDARRRSDLVHVVRRRVFDFALALQHGAQDAAFGIHGAHERDALVAPDRDRSDRAGEEHRRAQRQNGDDLRNLDLLDGLVAARHDRDHAVFSVQQFGHEVRVVRLDGFDFIFFTHSLL